MSQALVSVIIPIYNVGKYIDKCIQSVLSQTYKNIELILVDDGSPDDAGAICDNHAKNDERIKVIHKKNGGVSSARNAGLDVSQGDYVMFIDGDDWVDENHVEYLLSLIKKADSSMSMSYGIHTGKSEQVVIEDRQKLVDGMDMAADLLYHRTVIGSYNKLFKRELILDNKIRFNEKLFIGEGFNFIVMCAQLSGGVATGTAKTYHYRLDNTESAMTKFNINKIHNNDLALDTIRRDFVMQSHKLTTAWNYARWITSVSFSVWMKASKSENKYSEEYKKMLHDIRHRAPRILVSEVGIGKKVSAIVALLSPKSLVYTLQLKKKVKSHVG